jgi:F0F1-type ATP synthase assembly protein I
MSKASGVGGRGSAPGDQGPGAGAFANFGLQFVVALLFFLYIGQWVDRRLGTAPVFLLIGIFVGAGGSFYAMYRKLMAAQEREDQARREAKEAAARARETESR